MKFYRTKNNEIINLDKIEAITPIKLKQMYDKDNDLSIIGRSIINSVNKDKWSVFGGKPAPHVHANCYFWDINKSVFDNDDIVAYAIHLGCPSGGINNSHLTIYITIEEEKDLEQFLEIV